MASAVDGNVASSRPSREYCLTGVFLCDPLLFYFDASEWCLPSQ